MPKKFLFDLRLHLAGSLFAILTFTSCLPGDKSDDSPSAVELHDEDRSKTDEREKTNQAPGSPLPGDNVPIPPVGPAILPPDPGLPPFVLGPLPISDAPSPDVCLEGTPCGGDPLPCEVQDTCDENGNCQDNGFKPSTEVCREADGACDVAETCTGTSGECPGDGFALPSVVCREVNGACDVEDFCTGTSADCPENEVAEADVECRAAAGICDVAETCNGNSPNCPANDFSDSTVVCRPSASVCDAAETCSGTTGTCPADAVATAGTPCRGSTGACDATEVCNGTTATCPSDSLAAPGTTFRPATGACDIAETCSGTAVTCPADSFATAGTTCRVTAGACDVAESCTGTSASCPSDDFVDAGTSCRASAGVCDSPELCTGTTATCPADGFVSAGVTCRVAADVCDAAETCTGSDAVCPADEFVTAGTTCRTSTGVCDAAELCTGAAASCPADAFTPGGTVCRAAEGACDLQETCTGNSGACPADAFAAAGTSCRDVSGVCDVAETCNGNTATCPADAFLPSTTECRPALDAECDTAENCTGTSAPCPADVTAPDGTTCDDATQTCVAGDCSCGNGTVDAPEETCDDGNIDPNDGCDNICQSEIAAWTCSLEFYDDGDTCDCGCGIVDPDCAAATLDQCETCGFPGSCSDFACPGDINPTNNAVCSPEIAGWSCSVNLYDDASNICHCGCGLVDPDCTDATSASCENCDALGACGFDIGCPGDIDPSDNSSCITQIPGWTCSPTIYDDPSDVCDCGCGLTDPDCNGDTSVAACGDCDADGSCGFEFGCPGDIDPNNNSTCIIAIPGWTCNPDFYNNQDGCDCGCGIADPDCPDALAASCEFCDNSGSCGFVDGCPGDIDPTNNAVCSQQIPGWSCDPGFYNVGDGCHCGCGIVDPDCTDALVGSCDFCDNDGSCSLIECPGDIDPTNNAQCV